MNNIELIGVIAAVITTAAYFPQMASVVRTKSTRDLSWPWITMMIVGITLWLAYGIKMKSLGLIFGNAITLINLAIIAAYKLRYNPEAHKQLQEVRE